MWSVGGRGTADALTSQLSCLLNSKFLEGKVSLLCTVAAVRLTAIEVAGVEAGLHRSTVV